MATRRKHSGHQQDHHGDQGRKSLRPGGRLRKRSVSRRAKLGRTSYELGNAHRDRRNWLPCCVGIPSLIYFAVQLREQTRERRQEASECSYGSMGRSHQGIARERRVCRDPSARCALFPRPRSPFRSCASAHFKIVSSKTSKAMYYSRREGILSSELWDEIERTMSDFLAYDGVRQWWETRKHWHTEAFVGVVDAIIARGDKPTAYSTYNVSRCRRCLNTADERSSRVAANRRCRCRSAVGGYFGGMFARAGAPTVFIGRKHFADAVNSKGLVLDKSEGQRANARQGDNRNERSARLLADSVLRQSKRYVKRPRHKWLHSLGRMRRLFACRTASIMRIRFALRRTSLSLPAAVYVAVSMPEPGRVKHLARGDLIIGPPSEEQRNWQIFSFAPVFHAECPTTSKANSG